MTTQLPFYLSLNVDGGAGLKERLHHVNMALLNTNHQCGTAAK
jgi:hypothetical protein